MKKKFFLIILIIIAVVAVAAYLYGSYFVYGNLDTLSTMELAKVPDCTWHAYKDGFLRCTSDGAYAVDADGERLWNVTYDMRNPIADVNGECAAIADKGGDKLYICDGSETVCSVTVRPSKILDVETAQQGVTAVWTAQIDDDYFFVYDSRGNLLLEMKTTIENTGFPVDMDLSADGQRLAVAFVDILGDAMTSKVVFYNFSDVGKNYPDRVVGTAEYEDGVSRVSFMGDSLTIFRENGLSVYEYKELPALCYDHEYEEQPKSVVSDGKNICVIYPDGQADLRVEVYDTKRPSARSFMARADYTHICYTDGELAFIGEHGCTVYRKNGRLKVRPDEQVLPKNVIKSGMNKYLYLYDDGVQIVRPVF